MDKTFVKAFEAFGTRPLNPQWAVSADAPDGSIVMSCWDHRLRPTGERGVYRYIDALSRFRGNVHGTNLLRAHLEAARNGVVFRLINAVAESRLDIDRIEAGEGADKVRKKFYPKPNFVGTLESFDGDEFQILFRAS